MIEHLTEQLDTWWESKLLGLQTSIDSAVNKSLLNISSSVLDVLTVVIMVSMVWACYCTMMKRTEISLPLLGKVRPLDSLFFMCCAYIIVALCKAKADLI